MQRLKTTQVTSTREALLAQQGGRCDLCGLPCTKENAVLDHDHRTGAVRSTLHRGCNALLGKVENNAARYGVRDIAAWAHGIAGYLRKHMTNITGLLHPTYKTEDEKRVARNTKDRKARALKKQGATCN